jgi:hypothetical protein
VPDRSGRSDCTATLKGAVKESEVAEWAQPLDAGGRCHEAWRLKRGPSRFAFSRPVTRRMLPQMVRGVERGRGVGDGGHHRIDRASVILRDRDGFA